MSKQDLDVIFRGSDGIRAGIRSHHALAGDSPIGIVHLVASVKKLDPEKRQFEATITSERLDRDNEVLIAEGMDPSDFLKNPVIFWNHDYAKPVGKALDVNKRTMRVTSKAQIAQRPADHQGEFFPDYVWALVDQDIIKGVSVGFIPSEWRDPTENDRRKFGDVRTIHSKWKLLEWSLAPLQCNVDAVVTAVGKGLIDPKIAKAVYPGARLPQRKRVLMLVDFEMPAPKRHKIVVEHDPLGKAVAEAVARSKGQLFLEE